MFVLNVLKKMGNLATKRIWTNKNDGADSENVDLQEVKHSMLNDDAENLNVDPQEVKQLILDAVLEKEELQWRLTGASTFVEDMIENSKWVVCQLDENYNELRDKYRIKEKDLNAIDEYVECLNIETDDLNKNFESSKCYLNELEEENACLQDNINKLEESLVGEEKIKTFLKYQNQNQIKCLKQKSEEILTAKQKLAEKTDELKAVKEEIDSVLKPKLDNYVEEEKKIMSNKSQQIINLDRLKRELEMENKYGEELNQTINQQKSKNQELTEEIEKCNEKIEILKQMMENDSVETKNSIEKLRGERAIVEKERRKLETELNESKKEIEKLEHQNDQLNTDVFRLQYKLDGIIKSSDENQKLSLEKFEEKRKNAEKLMTDLNSKKRFIVELENILTETRKMHKMEAENAHNLKIKLNDLKREQNLTSPIKFGQCPGDGDHNIIIKCDPQTNCVNDKLLDNFKSPDENINPMTPIAEGTSIIDDSKENNQKFEKLNEKCHSLVND